MAYDADEHRAALTPPSLKLGGRTYVGRLLSLEEWLPFEPRMQKAVQGAMSYDEFRALILEYCDQVFPRPRWAFWRRRVGALVLRLPPVVMNAVVQDFLGCQARATPMGRSPTASASVDGSAESGRSVGSPAET